jgi:ferredoxin
MTVRVMNPNGRVVLAAGGSQPNERAAYRIQVDYDRCAHCGACVAVCPPDSIALREATLLIDQATCTRCERCVAICPTGALRLSRV